MPLTKKGHEILGNMEKQYGKKKGKSVFYASANKGTITGVHKKSGGAVEGESGMAAKRKFTPKAAPKNRADMAGAANGQGTVSEKSVPAKVDFPGKQVMKESRKPSAGFKRGGAVQSADGNCPPGRMDKKRRGGSVTMRGRSPISGAGSLSGTSGRVTH